ncbi:MAG: family lipase [Eubacterium sp.]|nr:family lipase [Eubacterium sp.]
MLIENNSKLIMIGDSVTDCERGRPFGEGLFGAVGKGYVGLVSGLLDVTYPEKKIRVVNMGISGNTVVDLCNRWETDVLDLKPDWLSIMIGVNDVWRQFDTPLIREQHVYLEEYSEKLEKLVRKTQPKLKGLVLMTPYFIESNKNDPMRSTMDNYGEVVKAIASKYNTILVDTQAAFDEVLKHCHPVSITWDRIHPNVSGHMVLARAFLNALGYSWQP